jgi:steroid delta-isomerase-like uncharacterized protein
MTHEEMIELCRVWLDAFSRHDLPCLTPLYSETTELESPMAGHISGREAVVKASEGLFGAFPDVNMVAEPPLIDGDRIAITAEFSGTHVGAFMGLAPTNKRFRFRLVFLLDVRDGKIVRDRRVYDSTGLLVQLGVLRAKPV